MKNKLKVYKFRLFSSKINFKKYNSNKSLMMLNQLIFKGQCFQMESQLWNGKR